MLVEAEHQGNSAILNTADKASEINRAEFEFIRQAFWKDFVANLLALNHDAA